MEAKFNGMTLEQYEYSQLNEEQKNNLNSLKQIFNEFKEFKDKMNDTTKKSWSDDDMIMFAEWYKMWYSHPDVGTNGYSALKEWKKSK